MERQKPTQHLHRLKAYLPMCLLPEERLTWHGQRDERLAAAGQAGHLAA